MESAKIKLRNKHIFMALLVVSYAIRAITDAVFVAQKETSIWVAMKYIPLMLAVGFGYVYLYQSGCKRKGLYIIKRVALTAGVLLAISTFKMVITNVYSIAVLELMIYMLLPAVVVVMAMSILTTEEIYGCMAWILCIAFASYCVLEVGLASFTAKQFSAISFDDSQSPFESHYSSGTAMALCAYFCYFRQKKRYTIVSLVFSLLTFKRMMVVYSLVAFVLPMFVNVTKRVSKHTITLCATMFVVLTLGYYWGLIPENNKALEAFLGIDSIQEFTSYRNIFFARIYKDPAFVNFGWGSCEKFLGKLFEMDLLQLLIETSVVGLIVFTFSYWKATGTTLYSVIYMLFIFANMLTSHSIQNAFIWSIIWITLAEIERDNVGPVENHRKWRIVFRNGGVRW